jgi:hypothetical protein
MTKHAIGAVMVILSVVRPAAAVAQDLAGTWTIQSETTTVTNDSGGTSTAAGATTTATLKQSGETVTGTWSTVKSGDWPLKGRLQGNRFELETDVRDLPVIRNGEKTTVKGHWTFSGTIDNDALRGTMSLQTENGATLSQPFAATRKR